MTKNNKQEIRRKKKRKQEARSKDWHLKQKRIADFPTVEYRNVDTPKSLADEVERIMNELVVSQTMPSQIRKSLRFLKEGKYRHPTPPKQPLSVLLGREIYRHLSQTFQSIFRMAHDIEIDAGMNAQRKIRVTFRSLEQLDSRVFSSPRTPTIYIEGRKYRIAFRDHAIEQIGNRTVFDPDYYECRGQAFAIPYWCKYFEIVRNQKGQALAKIWNWCDPSTFLGKFHGELLGSNASARHKNGWPYFEMSGQLCYYLVGYCPLDLDESTDIALCKTLLLPGMDNTPEHDAICKLERLNTIGRSNLSKAVGATTYARLWETRDFEIIRKLHGYAPQVKPIAEKVFDYPWLPG